MPGQLLSSIDPRSRAGLANLASMFAGGGEFDASPEMEGLGMPGQFEEYSPTKANLGGKLGSTHEGQPHQVNYSIRAANKGVPEGRYGSWSKFVHDSLFGGEAHLKGPVPKAGSPHEFSFRQKEQQQALNDHQALQELLAKSEEHQAKQEAIARVLRNHGIAPMERLHQGHPEILAAKREYRARAAESQMGRRVQTNQLRPNPARQEALSRMLAQQLHNHRN